MDYRLIISQRKQHLCGFLSVLFWGLFAHGFMFLNKLSYHDDIGNFGVGNTWTQGRWMLGVLGIFNKAIFGTKNFSTPWFEGILSLIVLAFSCLLIIELFDFKSKKSTFLLGALMAVFPVITAFFGYMFTAYYYIIALFLSVLSVFLFCKYKSLFTWILAVGAFTCSIGIYQAFIPFELGLLVLYMLKDVYQNEKNWKDFFFQAGYYVFSCLLSFAAYYLIEKFFLFITHHEMSSYKGMDGFGVTSVSGYFGRILSAYRQFFFQDAPASYSILQTYAIRFAYLALIFLGIISAVCLLHELVKEKKKTQFIQILILLLIFPLATKFILVMVPENVISSLMVYADILPVLFIFLIIEHKKSQSVCTKYYFKALVFTLVLFASVFYARYANICYFKLQFQQEQAKSFFTTLSARIQSLDGYSDKMPLAYINVNKKTADYLPKVPEWDFVNTTFFSRDNLLNDYNWDYFMKFWCGYEPEMISDTSEIEKLEAVKNMPSYPLAGSIAIIDNVIVVKF